MVNSGLLSLLQISLNFEKQNIPLIFLYGTQILPQDSVNILGFIFDTTLTWKPHIDTKTKKCMSYLYHLHWFLDYYSCTSFYLIMLSSAERY